MCCFHDLLHFYLKSENPSSDATDFLKADLKENHLLKSDLNGVEGRRNVLFPDEKLRHGH